MLKVVVCFRPLVEGCRVLLDWAALLVRPVLLFPHCGLAGNSTNSIRLPPHRSDYQSLVIKSYSQPARHG